VARADDVQDSIQEQIRSEKIGALRRATDRLERALERLAAFDAGAAARWQPAAPERRADLLAEAGERLWCLVIQREAMGLLRHEVLYDVLRIPGEVRRAMGPRRRGR
jgi:hypothetical protein